MNNLSALFARLVRSERHQELDPPMPNTILDLPVMMEYGAVKETRYVMPRLRKKTMVNIAKGAEAGNLDDMLTLGMMYSVGLGFPESPLHAYTWSSFSTMTIAEDSELDFESAVEEAKEHCRAVKDDFVYPANIDRIYRTILPDFTTTTKVRKGNVLISPLLAGVRIFAIYRVLRHEDKSLSYLYDVRAGGVDGDVVALEYATKLNIPLCLGEYKQAEGVRLTIPDYAGNVEDMTDEAPTFFVVCGTLTIPRQNKSKVKKYLPDVRTVAQVFEYFLSTDPAAPRVKIKDTAEYMRTQFLLSKVKEDIRDIESGKALEDLRERYAELRLEYRKTLDDSVKVRANEVRAKATRIRNEEELASLQKQEKRLRKALKKLREENNEHKEQETVLNCPESLFEFYATDIYFGNAGKLEPLPVGQHLSRHLQSIGFKVLSRAGIDNVNISLFGYETMLVTKSNLDEKSVRKAVEKYRKQFPDLSVSGIIVRSIDLGNVKKAHKTPVHLIVDKRK